MEHIILGADADDLVLAPENFSMVETGVYRSAFPRAKNQSFLLRLGIKTIIPLVPEDYPVAMTDFCNRNGIRLISSCGVDGNKWPFKEIEYELLCQALYYVMKQTWINGQLVYEYRPCLVHCNKGKHRTGSLIGCLRRLRGWSLSAIMSEYLSFANPKPRLEDQRFIEAFDTEAFRDRLLRPEVEEVVVVREGEDQGEEGRSSAVDTLSVHGAAELQ